MPSSVFVRDLGEYISELALNFSSRCHYDGGHYSEPLMYLECYKDWLASDKKLTFSRKKSLSHARMLQLDMLTADLASKVMGLLTESPADLQHHTKVSLLLASARRRGRCQAAYRMLTYAHVCSRMLTYAHVCSRMHTGARQASSRTCSIRTRTCCGS